MATPNEQPPTDKKRKPLQSPWSLAGLLVGILAILWLQPGQAPTGELPLTAALASIDAGEVREVFIDDQSRTVTLTYTDAFLDQWESTGTQPGAASAPTDNAPADEADAPTPRPTATPPSRAVFPDGFGPELVAAAQAADVVVAAKQPTRPSMFVSVLFSFLPLIVILGLFLFLARKSTGGIMGSFSKMPRGAAASNVPTARFSDVAGLEEVVDELREVVEYLHQPDKFRTLGGDVPHGFLLVGPPGTGKTMLARCVAGEAGVPFFALSGSDFVETFVGVGAARVRKVFDEARKAGRAIVFIDELDAVGRARGAGGFSAANEESERTLNALLVEMDGFQRNDAVIVLAATNRPEILDQALLRPGRFDRQVLVPLPDRAARAKILAIHLRERPLGPTVDLDAFARRCVGCSGADLAFIINEAALEASRRGATTIDAAHLDHAHAVATLGRERRSAAVSDAARTLTAWHEAGHTVAAMVLDDVEDPVSVTIIPRGLTGGATWLGGTEESFVAKRTALAQLTVALAGRAGEQRLVGENFTSGAAGDLQAARALATKMVREWGMGERMLCLDDKLADEEVEAQVRTALARAVAVLDEHAALHEAVAAALLEEETLDTPRLEVLRATHVPTAPPTQ